jgi:hypothetical protein
MSGSLNNPLSVGDWPQQPAAFAETYIPDQLIAGSLKLVTDSVLIGGNASLPRGALLGLQSLGTLASSAGKTQASGTITVAAVPTAGDTVTIEGTVITFVAANPSGNQVLIGGPGPDGNPVPAPTAVGTTAAFLNFLNGSTDANLVKCTYALTTSTEITVTAAILGTGGNAYTLATSDTSAFTLSGADLAGGTNNTGAETIGSLVSGALLKSGNYLVAITGATAFNVFAPTGDFLGTGVVGTAYIDQQIGFTVTTGASIAAGDQFYIAAAAPSGNYVLATAAAVDGSQHPAAILADYATPTTGTPVTSGIYLMGEFNPNAMTFGAGISLPAAKAALRPLGIFLKDIQTAADPS